MTTIQLVENPDRGRLRGSRFAALPLRDRIESLLAEGHTVTVDFAHSNPTQSFVDELIGALVMDRGLEVLKSLKFANCTDEVKAIIHFVVSDRLDHSKRQRRSG